MSLAPTRVLVIDDNTSTSHHLATFLSSHHYEVQSCRDDGGCISDVLAHWRPHVLVLAPREGERHDKLEELRRLHPRMPVVVLTAADGPDLLLDLEAFAPALAARPTRGLRHIESAVEAAATFVS